MTKKSDKPTDELDPPPADVTDSTRFRAGETVRIVAGKHRGSLALVHTVFPERLRVLVRSGDLVMPTVVEFDEIERTE